MSTTSAPGVSPASGGQRHEPFKRVAPFLRAALLIASAGGFLLASLLTLAELFALPPGVWWSALVQTHGHLQLYGWAGLFVLGVSLHFLPRLRGSALPLPRLLPWLLGAQVSALVVRAVAQPLLAIAVAPLPLWRGLLVISALLECLALSGATLEYLLLLCQGPPLAARRAFLSIAPFIALAALALALAAAVNLLNMVQAARSAGGGLAPAPGDELNITLGLFGFLVPLALAVSAQSLPMYAGLQAFPRQVLWPLAFGYAGALLLMCLGIVGVSGNAAWLEGGGLLLSGAVIAGFVSVFLLMMRRRGRLPAQVAAPALRPEELARSYRQQTRKQAQAYGPFVALVASAYLWTLCAALLLLSAGVGLISTGRLPFSLDAPRHSLAMGLVTLLICGIAPRMVPGFSGGRIRSPALVAATLWLGNLATLLRVAPLLLASLPGGQEPGVTSWLSLLFGLSGPCGLAVVLALTVNLWPALSAKEV